MSSATKPFQCNHCWHEVEPGGKLAITACGHCYCLPCAQRAFQESLSCKVCGTELEKGSVKVTQAMQDSPAMRLSYFGQEPESVLTAALDAIDFYQNQQKLSADREIDRVKSKLKMLHADAKGKLLQLRQSVESHMRRAEHYKKERDDAVRELQELGEKYNAQSRRAAQLQAQLSDAAATQVERGRGDSPYAGQVARVSRMPAGALGGLRGGAAPYPLQRRSPASAGALPHQDFLADIDAGMNGAPPVRFDRYGADVPGRRQGRSRGGILNQMGGNAPPPSHHAPASSFFSL